jgi:hypothetical protein
MEFAVLWVTDQGRVLQWRSPQAPYRRKSRSQPPKVRYLDVHEGTELDQKQFSAWVAQASRLPGWQMASPDPSIERTSSGRLRLTTAAARVER